MKGTSPENAAGCSRDSLFQTLGGYFGLSQRTPSRPTPSGLSSSTRRYLETLELAPGLKKLLGDGKLVNHLGTADDDGQILVHTASDYSYSADRYAGDGWRVIGDAGGG